MVGMELRVHERRVTLPDSKRQKYVVEGLQLCETAEASQKDLVLSEELLLLLKARWTPTSVGKSVG